MDIASQLIKNVAERDFDYQEALIDNHGASLDHHSALARDDKLKIQDGLKLGTGLHQLRDLIANNDWDEIKKQSDYFVTICAESGNALEEFGQ